MFSKYKRKGSAAAEPAATGTPPAKSAAETPARPQPVAPHPVRPTTSLRRPMQPKPAEAASADRDRKRRDRLQEIKLELHRALLDNLNLSALEHATEADLRGEINAIATEILEEKGIVLNREDADEIQPVTDVESNATARRLAAEEGIFVGISGGATVAAALQVAQKAKPGDVLLAMLPDTGERYFSTPLFEGVNEGSDDEWLASLGEAALP